MIVGPLLHKNESADAIGLFVSVLAVAVLEIFKYAVVTWMVAVSVYTLFFPDFDMIRRTAFGQHPRLIIANGYQADSAPEAESLRGGKRKQR